MLLIINHSTAWAQAVSTHGLQELETPTAFPVLISFDADSDTEDPDVVNAQVITMEQASKFLSVVPVTSLTSNVKGDILAKLGESLGIAVKGNVIKTKPVTAKAVIAVTPEGTEIALNMSSAALFKPGETINFNGETYTVKSVNSLIPGIDPSTGIDGVMEVKDSDDIVLPGGGSLPGLELPIDPSKLDSKQKIAEVGELAHVLDEERAI